MAGMPLDLPFHRLLLADMADARGGSATRERVLGQVADLLEASVAQLEALR
jgi:hypothetical protein